MAIAVKLDDLLHDRRMTLTELADRIGMTLANLSILKTGKARAIRFSTLEAICDALSCQPGDILRFEPEQAERDDERRPNEAQRHVDHHVSALDPLADASLTDDIVRGISKGGPSNTAVLILVVWLYGTLVLAERRSGYVIMLLVGLFAAAMPVIHMRGAHYGEIARVQRRLLLRLDALGARRARGLHLHPLGARTVELQTAPTAVVHQPKRGESAPTNPHRCRRRRDPARRLFVCAMLVMSLSASVLVSRHRDTWHKSQGAVLVTCDRKLARAPGLAARVESVPGA